ncbi:MAG: ATP-binding protein [bacterium]
MTTVTQKRKTHSFKMGQKILSQGDPGNSLLSILAGEVRIIKNGVEIATRGPGELLGEMALLERTPRSATAIAATDCEIAEYSDEEFTDVIREMPELALKMLRSLSHKLRESDCLRLDELKEANLMLTIKNRELSELNTFLEQLFRQSPAGIILTSPDGEIEKANLVAQRELNLGDRLLSNISEAFVGGNPLEVLWREGRSQWSGECTLKAEKGTQSVLLQVSRLKGHESDGKLLLIFEDISRIKELNRQIAELEKLIATDDAVKEIAHDVKNYMAGLKGYFDLLCESCGAELLERNPRAVDAIHSNLQQVNEYLHSLMTNQAQFGEYSDRDLCELVRVTVAFLTGQKRYRDINIVVKTDPDFPRTVRLNETQLHLVLLNLLDNAADALSGAAPEIRPQVKIELRYDHPGSRVIMVISDNGRGVEPDLLRQMFVEPFTTKDNGHGIGLITIKRFIDNHGGTIRAESSPGQGTKIIITLPA